MYLISIGLIIGIIWGFKSAWNDWLVDSFLEYFFFTLFAGAVGMFVAGLISLVFSVLIMYPTTTTEDLVALSDGSQIEGSFFLGSGNIEGRQYYFYYSKHGDGFKQDKISVDKVTVYEFEEGTPRIEREIYEVNQKYQNWTVMNELTTTAKIHIPSDSIKRNFDLDLN